MKHLIYFFINKRHLILFILFLVTLILRITLTYLDHSTHGTSNWADAALYLSLGESFADGDFYNFEYITYMPVGPVIPLLVAGSKLLTGDPIWPVLFLNCLLTSIMIFPLFWLGSRLIGLTAGYMMVLWGAFNLGIIRLNHQILKEPALFLLIPLVVICLVNIYRKSNVLLNVILSSILFSILIHTDERFFIYAPIFLLFVLFAYYPKVNFQSASIWIIILLITMAPWTFRNYKQFGELVLITQRTTAITSKLGATDFANIHFNRIEARTNLVESRKERALELAERHGVNPRLYDTPEVYYKAFIHYWQPTYFGLHFIQYGYRGVKWSLEHNLNSIVFYGFFLPFYVVGIYFALKKKHFIMSFLWTLPFIHGLLHTAMIWPLERYRLPMNFLVVLVALWVMNEIVVWWKNSNFLVEQ